MPAETLSREAASAGKYTICRFEMRCYHMKPNYKNWVPKILIVSMLIATALSLAAFVVFGVCGLWVTKAWRIVLGILFAVVALACGKMLQWSITAYRAFSYEGKRQLSRQIVEGTAKYITLPNGGTGLDVGCGSGALTIACAKQNPQGNMVGVDRWGKDYAEFSLSLCQNNAKAEHVSNTTFQKGDATKLPFADETFDAVTSNYVYHNISGYDKQQVLLETLRVLKKGGTFAIHDLMGKNRYGDMEAFCQKLKAMGYTEVRMIDTTDGTFMSKKEARCLMLKGSTLLVGRK